MSWNNLAAWWLDEVANDPAYDEIVTPLLLEILRPEAECRYLDLGSGEGRVMRRLATEGVKAIGLDLNEEFLTVSAGPAVVAALPWIPLRDKSLDGVYSVLTLEHVADHESFFRESARVTRAGGVMALIINHPIWTAPGSTPITDTTGEVLWRFGEYFSSGSTEVPAGEATVIFNHRTMASLLNAAAEAGWNLEQMIEQSHHELEDQEGIPRLLACRWRR